MDFSLLRKFNFQKVISGYLLKTFRFSSNKMSQNVKSKIENLYKKPNLTGATYNKVNKSNLFVTVFAFTPASKKDPAGLKPGRAHLPPRKSSTVSLSRLRTNLHRDTAPGGFDYVHLDRFKTCFHKCLYRDYASPAPICTMMAKTRAMLRSLRPY